MFFCKNYINSLPSFNEMRKNLMGIIALGGIFLGCHRYVDKPLEGFQQSTSLFRDEPPQLGIYVTSSFVQGDAKVPEFTLSLPGLLSISDISGDGKYDIVGCKALKRVHGSEYKEFFRTAWENTPNFTGNDIQTNALEISLEHPEFEAGKDYEICISCWDRKHREGSITLSIHTKHE